MNIERQFARYFKFLSPRQITVVIGMNKYALAIFWNYTYLSEIKQTKYREK